MCVADGDQEIYEFDQQVVHLLVVGDAPVVCILPPDNVCLAESEQAGQALPGATVPDQDMLTVERGLHAHVGAIQETQGMVRLVSHGIPPLLRC